MEVYQDHLITRGTKNTLTQSQPTNWQNGPLSGPFDSKGDQTHTNTITTYRLTEWTIPGPFNTEGIKHTLPLTQPTYVNLYLKILVLDGAPSVGFDNLMRVLVYGLTT